jgi:hypothetical protein
MPTLRRREAIRRPDLENLNHDQRSHLLNGWALIFGGGFKNPDTFKAAWAMHADELQEEFRAEHRNETFARPFGWWFCEHGKERPVLLRDPESLRIVDCIRKARGHWGERFHFGFLHTSLYRGTDWAPLQQPEWEYLRDKNLLTDEEREFIDFEEITGGDAGIL